MKRRMILAVLLLMASAGLNHAQVQTGPITSDEKFFCEVLNLDYPGLEEVKAAVSAKDWTAARTAYVRHLKTRRTPVWFFDWRDFDKPSVRVAGYNSSAADKIAGNLLTSCSVPYQFGNHIDWAINPTKPYYMEWTWQLSRHPFWNTLGQAYWATGDEKYAKAFVRQLRGWIIDNPLPSPRQFRQHRLFALENHRDRNPFGRSMAHFVLPLPGFPLFRRRVYRNDGQVLL